MVGEIINETSDALRGANVDVNVLDGSGSILTTENGLVLLDFLILPGEKGCFIALIGNDFSGWDSISFEAVDYSSETANVPSFSFQNHSGAINEFDEYQINGEIRNDSSGSASNITIYATAYDSGGNVLDCDYSFPDDDPLGSGNSSPFELFMFNREDYGDVDSYLLQGLGEFD